MDLRGDRSWIAAGEELLAGAAFAAQEHRRVRLRDDADHLHHFPDGRAFSDDPPDLWRRGACLSELIVERLLQRALLVEEAFALRRQHAVEADGLADQIGDHFEEAEIVVETARILRVPDPDYGEGADHPVIGFNRNAKKRNLAAEPARDDISACGEQRILCYVLDRERGRRGDELIDDAARQGLDRLAFGFTCPAGARDNFRFPVLIQDHDHAEPHVEEAGQHIDDVPEGLIEARCAAENLGNLVQAQERNPG